MRIAGTNILVGGHIDMSKMGVLAPAGFSHSLTRSFHP
jgi:hypothetical protein